MSDNITGNKIPYNPTKLGEMMRGIRWRPGPVVPPWAKKHGPKEAPVVPEPEEKVAVDGGVLARALGGEVADGKEVDSEGHQEAGSVHEEGKESGDVSLRVRKEGNKARKPRVRKNKAAG